MNAIPCEFYRRPDTKQIARDLLGKFLFTSFAGQITAGMIVETEAYLGREDQACHAANGRKTKRTEIMYEAGGVAYVYLIYGIHTMFNVVTHSKGEPHAILVRAIEPWEGLGTMLLRRGMDQASPRLTAGPGALAAALGLKREHTGLSLTETPVWLEDRGRLVFQDEVVASPRVGVDYAGEDALLPLRFRLKANPWTSPAK